MTEKKQKAFWDRRVHQEVAREQDNTCKQIHMDLLWREINRCIGDRVKLFILDAGAGPGRFSIPLAERGHSVTHLDIAPKMVAHAQAISKEKHLATM